MDRNVDRTFNEDRSGQFCGINLLVDATRLQVDACYHFVRGPYDKPKSVVASAAHAFKTHL